MSNPSPAVISPTSAPPTTDPEMRRRQAAGELMANIAEHTPARPPAAEPNYRAPTAGHLTPQAGMKAVQVGNEVTYVPDPDYRPAAAPPPGPTIALEDLPAGDPADVAVRLLARLRPGAAAELAPRLAHVEQQIDDLVEQARLHGAKLPDFIDHAIRLVRLRSILAARAAALADDPPPPPVDLAAEVHALVRSVRAWRDGSELDRLERAPRAAKARGELNHVEWEIGQTIAAVHGKHVPADSNTPAHRMGLYHGGDVWLQRLEGELARRAACLARLEALGDFPDLRAAAVKAAVEAAGRDAVAAAIAPAMAGADRAAAPAARLGAITAELGRLDAETRAAAGLRAEGERLAGEIEAAAGAVAADRLAAAGALIARAESGDLGAIVELDRLTRAALPALADALAATRGGDVHLLATVAEMVAEEAERIKAGR